MATLLFKASNLQQFCTTKGDFLSIFLQKIRLCFAKYLLVVKVVYEGGEAPGLVLHGQRQHWYVANEYGVKESRHFKVVTGTQRLETPRIGSDSDIQLQSVCSAQAPLWKSLIKLEEEALKP